MFTQNKVRVLSTVIFILLSCRATLAEEGFKAPSAGGIFKVPIENKGEVTIHGNAIDVFRLEENPSDIVTGISFQPLPGGDFLSGETVILTITPLNLGEIEDRESCESFKNPKVYIKTAAAEPLANYEDIIEIPVEPAGFHNLSVDYENCVIYWNWESCSCSVGGCGFSSGSDSREIPGCEWAKPDDNEILSTDIPGRLSGDDPRARVGVLGAPLFEEYAASFLDSINVASRSVDPFTDLGPDLYVSEGVSVLVIPSASLSPYVNSASFISNLDEYVSAGGVAVVFSQATGEDWSIVPGSPEAFGYTQDVLCYRGGARPSAYHLLISSEASPVWNELGNSGFCAYFYPNGSANARRVIDKLSENDSPGNPDGPTYPCAENGNSLYYTTTSPRGPWVTQSSIPLPN